MVIQSELGFDQRVAIQNGHRVDAHHALNTVFALLCLVRSLLRPDQRET
jgi:hypothetical protein